MIEHFQWMCVNFVQILIPNRNAYKMKKIILFSLVVFFAACKGDTTTADTAADTTAAPKVTTKAPAAKAPTATATAATRPATPAKPTAADLGDYKPKNEGWYVLLDEAFEESKKTGKPIMANFTGSDWCGWCKRLDKSVFHQPGFDKWADDNVVLLELDFPRRFRVPDVVAQQNRGLQQSFGVRGYPTVWLFDLDKDPEGKFNISALGKTGYTKTLDEFKNVMGGYISQRG